ncbi:MAG: chorismate synthase [Firmicutes bacterium]|nr:chorismate synthase [Bacillota bacterium]
MRYLSAGESHGPCLTAIIEGLPAGLRLFTEDINRQLERRQGGYGRGARMSIEKDRVEVLSGLRFNETIGSPLTLQIKNRDWDNWQELMSPEGSEPSTYNKVTRPRPGHADLAAGLKYNYADLRLALERSSARETAIRVAVGTVGRILLEHFGIRFYSHVIRIGDQTAEIETLHLPELFEIVESSPVRCADATAAKKMVAAIKQAETDGDTLGGVIELLITAVPPGLGSHVHWDRRFDGLLAGAIMAVPAIKGVEIGLGFSAATRPGSEVHDPIVRNARGIDRPSNKAGGLEGGITNGQPLVIRAAMKPIPTLMSALPSVDWETGAASTAVLERSDVCAVPAAAVVLEAVAAWTLAVAFMEKFAGDSMEELDAAYHYYLEQTSGHLNKS